MQTPFSDCEQAVRDIATWERHRIEFALDMANRGFRREPEGIDLGGWRRRAILLAKTADILLLLAPHERAVRAIIPGLSQQDIPVPSLWQGSPVPASTEG